MNLDHKLLLPEAPWIGLGCAAFGGTCSPRQARAILDDAWSAGVRYFDTARSYGHGSSEAILGAWLKTVDRRQVVLATKAGKQPEPIHPLKRFLRQRGGRIARRLRSFGRQTPTVLREESRQTAAEIDVEMLRESVSRSLEALDSDYLDVLLLHSVGAACLHDRLIRVLDDLLQQQIVRSIGLATNRTDCEELLNKGLPAQVVQFPDCAAWEHPRLWQDRPGVTAVSHSVLGRDGRLRQSIRDAFRKDAEMARRWSSRLGTAVNSEQGVVECLLRGAMVRNPNGGVLCGVSRRQQVHVIHRVMEKPLDEAQAEELQQTLAAIVR